MHVDTNPINAPHHIVYFPTSFLKDKIAAAFVNLPVPYSIKSKGIDQVNKKRIHTRMKARAPIMEENIMDLLK